MISQKLPFGSSYAPALIISAELLSDANAIPPVMSVNTAQALSDLTRLKPTDKKLAALLRPCEIRAVVELNKLNQVDLENIIIIGVDCPGTYPMQSLSKPAGKNDDRTVINSETMLDHFKKLEDDPALRSSCLACEHFTPELADIQIGLYGQDTTKNLLIGINTPSGRELLEPVGITSDNDDPAAGSTRLSAIEKLKTKRLAATEELEAATYKNIHGADNFLNELSNCINCHNCMTVCPICYCKECFFDSPTFDLDADKYLNMAELKGSIRLPANMFLFHITRFNHMVLSCIACGMCEQGCPVDIPLLSIYKTVGRRAQKVFDYEPGRSLDEEIPILTFQEDELEPK
jgi:formate dehydrogenase subunit beta